jgi:hypothetical protein
MFAVECFCDRFGQGTVLRIRYNHHSPRDRLQRDPVQADRCAKHPNCQCTADRPDHLTNLFRHRRSSQHIAGSLGGFFDLVLFVPPQMKRVGENDVAHDPLRMIIGEVNRRIDLEVRCDVPGKANGR